MPFVSPLADKFYTTITKKHVSKVAILSDFEWLLYEFISMVLIAICFVLSLTITSTLNVFPLLIPMFLLIYSLVIPAAYVFLMNKNFCVTETSQPFDQIRRQLVILLSMSLIGHYETSIGSLLGGTQWLVVALRRFGAEIDDDVIIEDMTCLDDVHLIKIGSHVRLSATSRIQVEKNLKQCNT